MIKTEITNMERKLVLQSKNTNIIDISQLPSGSYFLKTDLAEGKSVTPKIIKKP
ncbi:T9SS type A sorting domain-containing protein [Soonwooa sp.]|uniref:T9SS type A sorting domain-containing protein n=1 Tax=Soonwooa sp. TaxID=1938592 RepID=UPI0028A79D5E|nr:T9SS type A sorting domain-containing protein [Soonwooa sp.]